MADNLFFGAGKHSRERWFQNSWIYNIDDLMPAKPHLEKHSPYGQKERAEMMGMLDS